MCLLLEQNIFTLQFNYSDTSGSLWQFKRDEVPANNADLTDLTNSQSFKYKAVLVGKTANKDDRKSSLKFLIVLNSSSIKVFE